MPKASIFKDQYGWNFYVVDHGVVRYKLVNIGDFKTALYFANYYRAVYLQVLVSKFMPIAERMTVN